VSIELKLSETLHTEIFKLELINDRGVQTVGLDLGVITAHFRNDIMTLVCAKLIADGYSVRYTATPVVDSATRLINTAQSAQSQSSPSVVAAATVAAPERPSLSAVSVCAMYDEREKAADAHHKAEKEALDRSTMEFLHRCIQDVRNVERFKKDGKCGYVLRVRKGAGINADMHISYNIINIIPLIQSAVGPNETVEFSEDACSVTLRVMEI